jgi:hypothetical protein
MRSCLLALLVLATPAFAQQSAPKIPFTSVPNFPQMPEGTNLGEVPGVAVNSKGNVFVFTRSSNVTGVAFGPSAAQLFEFTSDGKFVREIGRNLYGFAFAHTVRIDKDDNIWTVDKGTDMIVKMNPEGRVQMVFGRREEATHGPPEFTRSNPPQPHQDGSYRQPTDVAWDSKGNIYITDGYINSRVAKLDKNGNWVKSWGEFGKGQGQFSTPHSIAIDRNDNIYVGDRGNQRVQVFDTDGKFLRMFAVEVPPDFSTRAVNGATPTSGMRGVGAPNSLCIPPKGNEVLFLGESTWPGRIFKLTLEGKVIGVIGESGRQLGQFSGGHQLACPSENEIYVAESSNWRVQKVLLQPTRTSSAGN